MPNCILERHQAQAQAAAREMGWPMRDDGGQIRVELPEDWAGEIVACTGVDLEIVTDFAAGVRRTGNAEDLRRRIESRGLLG